MSDPLAVSKTALEMRKRGHSAEAIDKLIYQNPLIVSQPVSELQNPCDLISRDGLNNR